MKKQKVWTVSTRRNDAIFAHYFAESFITDVLRGSEYATALFQFRQLLVSKKKKISFDVMRYVNIIKKLR